MALRAYSRRVADNIREYYGDGPPTVATDGKFNRGDRVQNDTPSAAGAPGWVCVTAGSPGTWKAEAAVAA